MSGELIYLRNTNTVELDELKNEEDGVYFTGATEVKLTVKDLDGVDVVGQVWPVTMTYIGANGKFRGRVNHDVTIIDGAEYDIVVTVFDSGTGIYGEWNDTATARVRGDK